MPDLADPALDQLFRQARTQNAWADTPVPEATIRRLYDLLKWGPTSANCGPGRFVFVQSAEAREKLAPHLSSSNRSKAMAAPVCVIVAYDLDFAEQLPKLFPHDLTAKHWFSDPAVQLETAFRNSSLQGAYLIMAARSLGLDCGPMSGFDKAGVDEAFFSGTSWRSNFLVALGQGKPEGVFPRNPRLDFDEACQIL
ncbi:malonic semialdehyde reductase [Phenylobacterium sp.]|uniref:malonic semialdehyde reductase n=1 Tax=Phenylobacterium sp. TaxID=1871053 RepID=UPI00272FEDE3|nr:malonic semialdehyde reductase [Phenylobacterium sp.]MDP1618732.1 malonic semialdehyde reductase [Phenylobacterium sp.]MDP1987247.1 malonic semialdehyde reductase [Phenylobacterium sp.]